MLEFHKILGVGSIFSFWLVQLSSPWQLPVEHKCSLEMSRERTFWLESTCRCRLDWDIVGLLQLSHRNIKLPNILSWKGHIRITEFNSWLHEGSPKNQTIEMKEMFLNLKGDFKKKCENKKKRRNNGTDSLTLFLSGSRNISGLFISNDIHLGQISILYLSQLSVLTVEITGRKMLVLLY